VAICVRRTLPHVWSMQGERGDASLPVQVCATSRNITIGVDCGGGHPLPTGHSTAALDVYHLGVRWREPLGAWVPWALVGVPHHVSPCGDRVHVCAARTILVVVYDIIWIACYVRRVRVPAWRSLSLAYKLSCTASSPPAHEVTSVQSAHIHVIPAGRQQHATLEPWTSRITRDARRQADRHRHMIHDHDSYDAEAARGVEREPAPRKLAPRSSSLALCPPAPLVPTPTCSL
jgi:hypothetical protein